MGCVNSKADINDRHPNIFQVVNINEQGDHISPGKLQVTETELVFYQRGKEPTKWPLRSLRKYGFDLDVFSFECGRRSPTGHGIYAFRCRKAEQLFNIVQQYISGNTNDDLNNVSAALSSNNLEFPIPAVSTGPPVQRRQESYIPPGGTNSISSRTHPTLSRPGSITSNGPVSPTTNAPPIQTTNSITDVPFEYNNNKRGSLIPEHSYTNTNDLVDTAVSYINLGSKPATSGSVTTCSDSYVNVSQAGGRSHLYMNIDSNCSNIETNTKDICLSEFKSAVEFSEETHCYANIDKIAENMCTTYKTNNNEIKNSSSVPQTPTYIDISYASPEYITVREVNYAELDLDNSQRFDAKQSVPLFPESPDKEKKSYASIDFEKTTALSQSINPNQEIDEGSRKTRHNSTINYNNSLSD